MPKSFEVPQAMGPGDKDVRSQLSISHPLQKSEAKVISIDFLPGSFDFLTICFLFQFNEHQLNLHTNMIRQYHGVGAQLKFMMELDAVSRTGRLPFLKSSNASRDALLGYDEILTPSDFLGLPEFSEKLTNPHAVMDKRAGIL
jgi:hypothetical protein